MGIACNTAHAPEILSRVKLPQGVVLVNMIQQTAKHVSQLAEGKRDFKVGLLATLGTLRCNVYDKYFQSIVKPDQAVAESVHAAIYDKQYGIKALSSVSDKAREAVCAAVDHLRQKGCSAVILGCTELPLVFSGKHSYKDVELVDPTEILAIELVRATEPDKLAL